MALPIHNGSSSGSDTDTFRISFAPVDDSVFSLSPHPSSGTTTPRQDTMKELQVPRHPIPSMQAAFAESMTETAEATTPTPPKSRIGNAAARRKLLIDQDVEDETHAARWKQKPGQLYHELWKLMAQISFGVYLLMNGIAKDDKQVMNILQGHVDEVDEFLGTTLEDFDLAQEDIEERLKFLKLPLENIIIFDAMLEDRNFRLQIVNGNERIEHVIQRTAKAMKDALRDVQQGLDACKEFTIYLAEEQEDSAWLQNKPDMEEVFVAMKGNVEGWYKAYVSLQTKGNHLGVALVQLGSIVAEMDRRASDISRKSRFSSASPEPTPMASPPDSPESKLMRRSMLKDLPTDPNPITPAIRATLPVFQLVQDRERTPEPEAESQRSSSEVEEEAEFTLKPHTYTPIPSPMPSPKPPPEPVQAPPSPPPEIKQRSSLRKRFSIKRKESPPNIILQAPPPLTDNYWGPRQRVQSSTVAPRERERQSSLATPLATPPSRGLDSAYCSDLDKTTSPRLQNLSSIPPIQTQRPTRESLHASTQPSQTRTQFANSFVPSPNFVPSPHSDQQFFRPVQASPHSPLQRPWTAGPSNPLHMHSNSSTSNLSSHRDYHATRPSGLGKAPSTMGMSVMSDMTTMTEMGADGEKRKVKKKRSAFGWLKKAFSLSEEEKAAFEEKRRGAEDREREREYYGGAGEARERRWVDGKRVDGYAGGSASMGRRTPGPGTPRTGTRMSERRY